MSQQMSRPVPRTVSRTMPQPPAQAGPAFAPPAVQAALLRLVLERRIGALQLPPGVRIVAAANPRSSAADGWELSPPLANRFVHLQWVHDHEVVVRGLGGVWPVAPLPRLDPAELSAAVAFARRAVCELLTVRPELVHRLPTNETKRGGAWPSPRSWDMTLRLIAFATAAGSSPGSRCSRCGSCARPSSR